MKVAKVVVSGFAIVAAFQLVQPAHAATLTVCPSGCEFSTIQSAIDRAVSGDTIHIGAGHYVENVHIAGKSLGLVGAGNGYTTVDGNFKGPVFVLGSYPAGNLINVSLSNLSATHGEGLFYPELNSYRGGGIDVRANVAFTASGLVVISNHSRAAGGGISIALTPGLTTRIAGCSIYNNRSDSQGGGVLADSQTGPVNSKLVIDQSSISRNSALSHGGGVAFFFGGLTMTNSAVIENHAEFAFERGAGDEDALGGGIYVVGGSSAISIADSVISDNTSAFSGGGASINTTGPAVAITRTIIAQNTAVAGATGADLSGVQLRDVYLLENRVAGPAVPGIPPLAGLVWSNVTSSGTVVIQGNAPIPCYNALDPSNPAVCP